jgi:hypothetical protein
VRGRRISKEARKKADLVIVAARYDSENGKLSLAQVYQRRGPIWGDIQILDRTDLIRLLEDGKRVLTGSPMDFVGDFNFVDRVQLVGENANRSLAVKGSPSGQDNLNVPLF